MQPCDTPLLVSTVHVRAGCQQRRGGLRVAQAGGDQNLHSDFEPNPPVGLGPCGRTTDGDKTVAPPPRQRRAGRLEDGGGSADQDRRNLRRPGEARRISEARSMRPPGCRVQVHYSQLPLAGRGSRLRPGEGRLGAACPSTPGPRCQPERAQRPQHEAAVQAHWQSRAGQGPVWAPCETCHLQCGARRKLKLTRGWSPRSPGSWHSAGIRRSSSGAYCTSNQAAEQWPRLE